MAKSFNPGMCPECGAYFEIHIVSPEGNQTQSESSAADCLAAGGGVTPSEPSRLAGREPCSLEGFERHLDNTLKALNEVDGELEYCDVADWWDFVESVKRCIAGYRSTAAKAG